MSDYNLVTDMVDMHTKFGVNKWVAQQVKEGNHENLKKFLQFRINFLEEELTETRDAVKAGDAEEIVDGLIDLVVIALGTLDAFDIDTHKAWKQVFWANISKDVGVKPTRPNPLGLPDLIKPKGWVGPSHIDNVGILPKAL